MIQLTRRYRFPAAHVLRSSKLSELENERIFGKCANPNGHGHDYGVEVSVTGPLDPETGQILAPDELDAIFESAVREPYSHHMLNDLEPFAELVPTAENIARVLRAALGKAVEERSSARVTRVRIIETVRNHFDCGEPG